MRRDQLLREVSIQRDSSKFRWSARTLTGVRSPRRTEQIQAYSSIGQLGWARLVEGTEGAVVAGSEDQDDRGGNELHHAQDHEDLRVCRYCVCRHKERRDQPHAKGKSTDACRAMLLDQMRDLREVGDAGESTPVKPTISVVVKGTPLLRSAVRRARVRHRGGRGDPDRCRIDGSRR